MAEEASRSGKERAFPDIPGAACSLTGLLAGSPDLHFGGAWLERAGFAVGQRVRVQVGKSCIVIEPIP